MIVDDTEAMSAPHRPELQAQVARMGTGPCVEVWTPPRTVAGLTRRERAMTLDALLRYLAGLEPKEGDR